MLGAQKFVAVTVNKRGCGQHSYVLHIPTYLLLHFWQIQKVQHNAAKPLFNWSGGAYARSKHSSEHILLNINGTKCVFSPSFLLQTIWFPNNWQQLCFSTALSYPLPITGRSRCYRHQVNHQHHNGSHCNSNSFLIKTSVRVCVWLCFVGADLGWLEKGMNSESVDYLTHKCRAKPLSPACARDGQAELAGQSGSEHEASSSLPQSTLRAYVYSSHTPATWPLALRMKESSCTRNMMQGD